MGPEILLPIFCGKLSIFRDKRTLDWPPAPLLAGGTLFFARVFVKVGAKWLKMAQNTFKMAQSMVKIGQNRSTSLKMAQNMPQMAQKQSDTVKRNGKCDQIPCRGTADGVDLRPLGRQGPMAQNRPKVAQNGSK